MEVNGRFILYEGYTFRMLDYPLVSNGTFPLNRLILKFFHFRSVYCFADMWPLFNICFYIFKKKKKITDLLSRTVIIF